MKSLVIVESPAKAKTINKFLGRDFVVKASVGHIKDLPSNKIGVEVDNNFEPQYVVIKGKEKVIRELKKAAKEAEEVFLAPDPDREGEAIAWHIAEELNGNSKKLFRIIFNEITPRAVLDAIKKPGRIDMNKVEAQQARRILDRLVGYNLSPLLWKKVRRGLSAGRVQSVALRLLVEREREIEAFRPEEYWSITAMLEGSIPPAFAARLWKVKDEKVEIKTADEANGILQRLEEKTFSIAGVEKKERRKSPPPPFITSTLQQEASRKLRFTAKKTMMLAQQLYEGLEIGSEGPVGLITYMRTDSVRLAPEAQAEVRRFIEDRFGKEYMPSKPPVYKSKASAQEAHEAIRATSVFRGPEEIKRFLTKDQYSLYRLIWNRYLASQMSPAILEQTAFDINAGDCQFRATGTVVKFPGFTTLYVEGQDEEAEEEGLLPPLKEGETLKPLGIEPRQHFTQPPPRYTEATLVKALEEKGIGRPSTYATILSVIQDRKYAEKLDNKFKPTELGVVVSDLLVERFPELMDIGFTAKMEEKLDRIEEGDIRWVNVVKEFYTPFNRDLLEAQTTLGRVKPKDMPTEYKCEKCGLPMVIKWGRHGRFLACSGFPECKNTMPLNGDNKVDSVQTNEVCEKCGSPMVVKSGRFGKFLACSRYPECKTTSPIKIGVKCPEDGGDIIERMTKKGKVFYSCSNYPRCKFATWHKPIMKKCPKCGADFLGEKKTKEGSFLICIKKGCGYKEKIEDAVNAP